MYHCHQCYRWYQYYRSCQYYNLINIIMTPINYPYYHLLSLASGIKHDHYCTSFVYHWYQYYHSYQYQYYHSLQYYHHNHYHHGVAFRGPIAEQYNVKPTCQPFCSTAVKALYVVAATVCKSSRTSSLCGPLLCVCGHCVCVSAVCYDSCACVSVCAGL